MTKRLLGTSQRAMWVVLAMGASIATAAVGCNDPDVRYGPVGGLRVRGGVGGGDASGACAYPPGTDETGATCPSWNDEVWLLFDAKYGCTRDGCHAGELGSATGAANLSMPPGDPSGIYDSMAAYTRGDRPYIGEGLQDTAYVLCNIWPASPTRIEPIMPIPLGDEVPLFSAEDLTTVGNWVACGMPKEGGGTGTGTGTGGMGGLGGAGGLGGGI